MILRRCFTTMVVFFFFIDSYCNESDKGDVERMRNITFHGQRNGQRNT